MVRFTACLMPLFQIQMALDIPLLQHLKVCPDELGNGSFISFDQLWKTMKKGRSCRDPELRKDAARRELGKYKQVIYNEDSVQVSAIIHYMYSHRTKVDFCQRVCQQMETRISMASKKVQTKSLLYQTEVDSYPCIYVYLCVAISLALWNICWTVIPCSMALI